MVEDSEPKENRLESDKNEKTENSHSEDDEKLEDNMEKSDDNQEVDPNKWEDILGSGSIMKRVLNRGQPDTKPQRYHICTINYVCRLENGIEIEKMDNFAMHIDGCDVVQGLDLSIAMMNIGEKCELIIEPRLAFGSTGLPPLLPGDTKVVFEVELVSAVEEDTESLTIAQRKERGNRKRERGNWWYCRGENTLAVQCYRRALDYLDELEGGIRDPKPDGTEEVSDFDLQSLLEDRINVCNNMAAAQIKLGLYEPALNSLETVLRCQPQNVKALYRKAKVYRGKNDFASSLKYLQKALEVTPDDALIQKEIASLNGLIKKQKVSEKELAKRMFNLKDESVQKKDNKSAKSKFQIWAVFGASIMVTLASIAAYKFKYV